MDETLQRIMILVPVALLIVARLALDRWRQSGQAAGGARPGGFIDRLKVFGRRRGGAAPSAEAAATVREEDWRFKAAARPEDREKISGPSTPSDASGMALAAGPASPASPADRPGGAAEIRGAADRRRAEPGRTSLPSRLGSMSQLRRAVVMAEILGRPKSLSEGPEPMSPRGQWT